MLLSTYNDEPCQDFKFLKIFFIRTELKSSRYEIEFWCCHERTLNNIQRTFYRLEALNRGLNQKSGIPHINLAQLIEFLKMETEKTRIGYVQRRKKMNWK